MCQHICMNHIQNMRCVMKQTSLLHNSCSFGKYDNMYKASFCLKPFLLQFSMHAKQMASYLCGKTHIRISEGAKFVNANSTDRAAEAVAQTFDCTYDNNASTTQTTKITKRMDARNWSSFAGTTHFKKRLRRLLQCIKASNLKLKNRIKMILHGCRWFCFTSKTVFYRLICFRKIQCS